MGFKFKLNNSGRYLYSLPGNGHFNIILLHFQTNCYSISQLVLELQAKDEFIFLTMHSTVEAFSTFYYLFILIKI